MISVIVPVYNGERFLRRCLDSITSQTVFEELEVIVVDDGSDDASPEIIDEYAEAYSSITGLHIRNRGVSNARNRGMDLASGAYLAFVDADDYLEPDCFETLLAEAEKGYDIVCGGFIAEYPDKRVYRRSGKVRELNREAAIEEFLKGTVMDPNIWNKLYRRETVGTCRFDSRLSIAEDKYFLFQCIKRARKVEILNVCKYHYSLNDASLCRGAFSGQKMDSLFVAARVSDEIAAEYPNQFSLAKAMEMDVACRVYGELYFYGIPPGYRPVFDGLKNKIRHYRLRDKMKYSSGKHFFAFVAARIHPGLYNFLKRDMRLQYQP